MSVIRFIMWYVCISGAGILRAAPIFGHSRPLLFIHLFFHFNGQIDSFLNTPTASAGAQPDLCPSCIQAQRTVEVSKIA
jgi:hypothetical protein